MFFNWRNMKFKSALSSISFSPSLLFALASLHSSQRSYSRTFSAFLRIIGGRQLYGSNLTPLFSRSTLVALWESITCRASCWARGWLLSHTLVCSPMKNGMESVWLTDGFFYFFFQWKGSKTAAEWLALIKLVSVRRSLLVSNMMTTATDTCAQLFPNILPSFTHTRNPRQSLDCLNCTVANHKTRIQASGTCLLLQAACQFIDMINTPFSCHRHWNVFAIFPMCWCACLCCMSPQLVGEPGQSDPAALQRDCSPQKY